MSGTGYSSRENTPFNIINDPVENRVAVGLTKVYQALKSSAWSGAGQQGLTPTQGEILHILRSRGDSAMRLSEIAEALAVTPATTSDSVSALVDKELVDKRKSQEDARAVAVSLTEKGKQEADRVASWPEFLVEALGELSLAERTIFLQGLVKVVRALQEREVIPVARMCVSCRFFHPNVYKRSDRPHHCAFVDAPFGTRHLQMDCPDHQLADAKQAELSWQAFQTAEQDG